MGVPIDQHFIPPLDVRLRVAAAASPASVPYPTPPNRPPSARTAETLVLVALVLQIVGAAIVVGLFVVLFGVTDYRGLGVAWAVAIFAVVVGAVSILFLFCAYEYSYLRIQRGQYQEAQAPTLVIGILSLFLGLIPGILYLVGYLKLGDALREQQWPPTAYTPAFGCPVPPGAAQPQFACRQCGRVYFAGQFQFCPSCGQKLGS